MYKRKMLQIFTTIREAIFSDDFRDRHKSSAKDFTRNRKLPFELLFSLIFRGVKTTIKSDIEQMWENILTAEYRSKTKSKSRKMSHNKRKKHNAKKRVKLAKQKNSKPTKAAFVKGRNKINSSAFVEIFKLTVTPLFDFKISTNSDEPFEIIAVDGSTSEIENTKKLRAHYGENTGSGKPLARFKISGAFSVSRDIFIDAKIGKYNTGERDYVEAHIKAALDLGIPRKKLLFIFDRGYPSLALTSLLNKYGVKYIMRVSSAYTKLVNNANEKDQVITYYNDEGKLITERVINVTLKSNENEKLLTNIMKNELSYEKFIDLYWKRWNIEKAFDTLKNALQIENYSAITPNSIEQDFYATLTMFNLLKLAKLHTDTEIQTMTSGKTHKHEVYTTNFNVLILKLRDAFTKMILTESAIKRRRIYYDKLEEILSDSESRQPIRNNRKEPAAHGTKCGNKFPQNKRCVI